MVAHRSIIVQSPFNHREAHTPLMDSPRSVYRSSEASPAVLALADRGRSIRESAGLDPHAMVAPTTLSIPLATVIEEIAASYEQALENAPLPLRLQMRMAMLSASAPAVLIYGGIFLASIVIVSLFALAATMIARWFVLLAPLTVVIAMLLVAMVRSAKEQPRRWIAHNPLRIDGYLDLLGREERVVRVRAVVRFAGKTAPDAELFKDVLTGAGVFSRGVEASEGAFAVYSPEINGDAATLHRWVQLLCDAALVPLDESQPISEVVIEER